MHSLGRLHIEDTRDQLFSIAPRLGPTDRTYRYWWPQGWWGDQGQVPMCVEFSWHHFLSDGPVTHLPKHAPYWTQGDLYYKAQKVDQWPGENYDGTSVRAGAKVLQSQGWIDSYHWAFTLQDVINTILMEGPMVVGTNWYEQMFYPDASNRIHLGTKKLAGGHAYLLNGVNVNKELFRIKNSWGRSWGNRGHAYISFQDFNQLLQEQGEACIALEKK